MMFDSVAPVDINFKIWQFWREQIRLHGIPTV